MPDREEQALWEFAVALYSRPGVEETALRLQAAGLNVNLLLWSCWLESRGIALDDELMRRAEARIREWDQSVVQALRSVRQSLARDGGEGSVREAVKTAELSAERRCLCLLSDLAGGVEHCPLECGENAGYYLSAHGVKISLAPLRKALAAAESNGREG